MRRLLFIVLLLLPVSVQAAPFCASYDYGNQCLYFDMKECMRAVGEDGNCIVNPEEAKAKSGNGSYCVVSSLMNDCYYFDQRTCKQAAAMKGATCVSNQKKKPEQNLNP